MFDMRCHVKYQLASRVTTIIEHGNCSPQEAEEQLQQSFRERARLEKQRAKLEHDLASWSSKLGVSIDLPRTESIEPSEHSDSDKVHLSCALAFIRDLVPSQAVDDQLEVIPPCKHQ